ncbi:MAG TPA: hypothetical protein VF529_02330 [Solirubrobacteraceae bacterium]
MREHHDLAAFLAETGAAVGGGAALAAALGLLAGIAAKDAASWSLAARERGWGNVRPVHTAAGLAPYGGVFGLAAVILRWAGVN